jgi:hypothetical protein
MTDRGAIQINRKIFANPLLEDPHYFRAWVWLLCEAAWKPRRQRVVTGRQTIIVDLQRGQLTASRRYMAKALKWTEQRVRTFLDHTKIDGMISLETNQGQMVITICKYDEYQLQPAATNPQSNQRTNQQSTSNQPKSNKDNNYKKEDGGAGAPASFFPPSAPEAEFAFVGATIRVKLAQFERWRQSYPALTDLRSVLQAADDYYTENPPRDGKWFFPVSRWLQKENAAASSKREQETYGVTWQ